ncbi:MAG: hypothetical protein HF977_14030 [ANME-2 cluster archaeon]|nr:hypothetical protein [ANME-2 cluster archaeon]
MLPENLCSSVFICGLIKFTNTNCNGLLYSYTINTIKEIFNWRKRIAKPIEFGLILKDEDARQFWMDKKNPKVTREQVDMFKEARQIYKCNFKQ